MQNNKLRLMLLLMPLTPTLKPCAVMLMLYGARLTAVELSSRAYWWGSRKGSICKETQQQHGKTKGDGYAMQQQQCCSRVGRHVPPVAACLFHK